MPKGPLPEQLMEENRGNRLTHDDLENDHEIDDGGGCCLSVDFNSLQCVRLAGRHILELGGNNAIIGEEHWRCYSYV